jgi:predicted nucleic acid-binding protein
MSEDAAHEKSRPTAFVDSNVITNAFDLSARPAIREAALEIVVAGFSGRASLAISNQVIGEVMHTMTRAARRRAAGRDPWSIAEDFIRSDNWRKLTYGFATLKEAARINRLHGLEFWDALVAATMMENDIYKIYTDNTRDFGKVPDLEVVSPFDGSALPDE